MPRNLERRVEILFPVEEPSLKTKLEDILQAQLRDKFKAHVLQQDGSYAKAGSRGKERFVSQEYFCRKAQSQAREASAESAGGGRRFVPETHQDA